MRITDQTGYSFVLTAPPKRIVSIVPSQTELLWDLGLGNRLCGISRFCIHPENMFRAVPHVGGTKQLNLDKIRQLAPDIIIGNKEENQKEQIEELRKEFNVWLSDIYTLEDAFAMVRQLSAMLESTEAGNAMVEKIEVGLAPLKNKFRGIRVAYFIWYKPHMLAAENTFIHHMLTYLGFENVLAGTTRYPQVDADTLRTLKPDVCFLSSEPFPFASKHAHELKQVLPHSAMLLADGEMFSWYGSRLLHWPQYCQQLETQMAELGF